MRDITLCIVNYNGADHLPPAFAAIEAAGEDFGEILVVDNASTDGSADLAEALCPRSRVLRLDANRGPGAARNVGFAHARNDLILFQDNDVRLEPAVVRRLREELDSFRDTLAVAPRVLYVSEPARVQFDSADCHFLGLMATRNADAAVASVGDDAGYTTSLVTACFLIDRARWTGEAPFDEALGFNLEDHDFAVRAVVAGHRLRVQPGARVLHGTGTLGLSYRPGQAPAVDRQFYLARNRWIVLVRCYAARTLLVMAPALLVFELVQLLWLAGQGRAGLWFRAVASLFRMRRRLGAERRRIQRSRRTPDSAILRDAPLPVTRHVHGSSAARLLPLLDRALRTYWRLVSRWIR
jgi:GT2 family glycosyltransferase